MFQPLGGKPSGYTIVVLVTPLARSRRPFLVVESGALSKACACRNDSQLPVRIPTDFTLFTLLIPAASSDPSSRYRPPPPPVCELRDILIMIDDEPSLRASSDARQALTVALLKPGRGTSWYQAMNSFKAML